MNAHGNVPDTGKFSIEGRLPPPQQARGGGLQGGEGAGTGGRKAADRWEGGWGEVAPQQAGVGIGGSSPPTASRVKAAFCIARASDAACHPLSTQNVRTADVCERLT